MPLKKKIIYYAIVAGLLISNLFWLFIIVEKMLRIAYAEEQIKIFYLMLSESDSSSLTDIESSLNYVKTYYPTGTKQTQNSRLDKVVELVRKDVIKQLEKKITSIEQNRKSGTRVQTLNK